MQLTSSRRSYKFSVLLAPFHPVLASSGAGALEIMQ